ncbi:MAG: hypothetical protein A2W26_00360 [Acidobacteria bacterium RBG_16_64_8]|nr:MAG: hypothetical protein A2W26_00360 [Acidobacteria bacterium RBG_16_64_8]
MVCELCAAAEGVSSFAISPGALATLHTLLETSLIEVERLELDQRATAEVEQVVAQILAYHGH